MGAVQVQVELPEDVAALLGPTDEAVSRKARQAVILELLRQGKIAQGKAARVLGVTRHDIIDLMAEHDVPSGPLTTRELEADIEHALRVSNLPAESHSQATPPRITE